MIEIRECRFGEIADSPRFAELCAEYAAECSMSGLPTPAPHADTYKVLDQSGKMKIVAAYDDGALVGFIAILLYLNPHYSALLGVVESFFVAKSSRGSGAGLKLLRFVETIAKDGGAAGLLISAPSGSLLASVMDSHKTYRETNRVFMRGFE